MFGIVSPGEWLDPACQRKVAVGERCQQVMSGNMLQIHLDLF